jgi:hypothetical protein
MAMTNEQLSAVIGGYFEKMTIAIGIRLDTMDTNFKSELQAVNVHLAQLNGSVRSNADNINKATTEIENLDCKQHGEDIATLKAVVGMQPTPREAGRLEAMTDAHAVNWTRVWGIVAVVLGAILTIVITAAATGVI